MTAVALDPAKPLRLCRASGEVEDELFSEACELETRLPGNMPRTEGYIGQA